MSKEIGTLRTLSGGNTQFIGSSSGIFFVNTVRRAFAVATDVARHASPTPGEGVTPEDYIAGVDDESEENAPFEVRKDASGIRYDSRVPREWGYPPTEDIAKKLTKKYFQTWHPIFPFLHGPSFLDQLNHLYAGHTPESSQSAISHAVIFQCIFNLALLVSPEIQGVTLSGVPSPAKLLPTMGLLSLKSDMNTIQALLATNLYLLATMALRPASSIGGLLGRCLMTAGFHRCPYRYPHMSDLERDMRKRIFWSAYTMERYLSQALGHPLGIQDSDIDVCSPNILDLHQPVINRGNVIGNSPEALEAHLPAHHPRKRTDQRSDVHSAHSTPLQRPLDSQVSQKPRSTIPPTGAGKQSILFSYVEHGRLVGRVLELFHKSIHIRQVDWSAALSLKADIDSWWHSLSFDYGGKLQDADCAFRMDTFFTVLYQQLIFLVNRPSLSLEQSTPAFRSALQTCIGAARQTISTLKLHLARGEASFWPGFMSCVWTSGLIIAFACQLGSYGMQMGNAEIAKCLQLLKSMEKMWPSAKHCHDVLYSMMAQIRQIPPNHSNPSHQDIPQQGTKRRNGSELLDLSDNHSQKRSRLENGSTSISAHQSGPNTTCQSDYTSLDDQHVTRSIANRSTQGINETDGNINQVRTGSNWSNVISPGVRNAPQDLRGEEYTNAPNSYHPQAHSFHESAATDIPELISSLETFSNQDSFLDTFVPTLIPNTGYHDMFEGVTWESLLNVSENFNI